MPSPIVYVDTSEIRPGRLTELKAAMADLAAFVESHEPRLIAYHVYFNDEGTRMTVLHIDPDSEALAFHMQTAGPKFPPIGEFIDMLSIDVYGTVSDALAEQLRHKAELLGRGVVRIHQLHSGFTRFTDAAQ
jgi:hypothetical protein